MTEVTFRNFTPVKSVWISLQSIYSSVPWGILSPHYTDFLIKIYFYNVVSIKVVLALFKVAWAKWADPWVITVITTQESAHATLCSTRKTLVSMVNLTVTWQKLYQSLIVNLTTQKLITLDSIWIMHQVFSISIEKIPINFRQDQHIKQPDLAKKKLETQFNSTSQICIWSSQADINLKYVLYLVRDN